MIPGHVKSNMSVRHRKMKEKRLPQAILFDFDGVITDSEPLHWKAFVEVLRPSGWAFSWEEYTQHYLGFDDRGVFRELFRRRGSRLSEGRLRRLMSSKANVFERLARNSTARPHPGVLPLIRAAYGRIPLALCTGALYRDVRPFLKRFGILRAFAVVVTADDVPEGKPSPRCYMLALARLAEITKEEVVPSRCVAIEDTPAGIVAAKRAGLRVIAVQNTYRKRQLAGAWKIVPSLRGLTLARIRRLLLMHDRRRS